MFPLKVVFLCVQQMCEIENIFPESKEYLVNLSFRKPQTLQWETARLWDLLYFISYIGLEGEFQKLFNNPAGCFIQTKI